MKKIGRQKLFSRLTVLEGDKKIKEICTETKALQVSQDENLIVCDFGWGTEDYGKFWRIGAYIWEVFIDDELVGTTKFYVEDAGRVTANSNPYFKVASLKTYEAPKGDLDKCRPGYI